MPPLTIQDPRAGYLQPLPEGLEYTVAVPLWGPWYQQSPWAWSDLPQESFYDPRRYPYPAVNPFIPKRSGAYIQPGQMDPLAYQLVNEGSLEGLGQVTSRTGAWLLAAIAGAALLKKSKTLGLLAAVGAVWWFSRKSGGLLGRMGQIAERDWFPEDPTGGGYAGAGDPVYGDVLGPGESIAVASNWLSMLHPRGFEGKA
jgi:hypothetical protein